MDCLPLAKKLRQILRKMLPSKKFSNGWEKLLHDEKENLQLNHNYCLMSQISSNSNSFVPNSLKNDFIDADQTFIIPESYLNENGNTDGIGSYSSGFGSLMSPSPPPATFKIHEDQELSRSFDYWIKPIQSYSESNLNSFDSVQSVAYSPLNSFKFADPTYNPPAFNSGFNLDLTPPQTEKQSKTNEIRSDFERNGRTVEINEPVFVPSAASTPLIHRRTWKMHQQQKAMQQQTADFYQPLDQQMLYQEPPQSLTFKPQMKRFRPNKKSLEDHCVFCKNNKVNEKTYRSHTVKDALGRVSCPTLRSYKCPICGEQGDNAHTVKYCPKKPIITVHDTQQM